MNVRAHENKKGILFYSFAKKVHHSTFQGRVFYSSDKSHTKRLSTVDDFFKQPRWINLTPNPIGSRKIQPTVSDSILYDFVEIWVTELLMDPKCRISHGFQPNPTKSHHNQKYELKYDTTSSFHFKHFLSSH
jgi:hypothetical protein